MSETWLSNDDKDLFCFNSYVSEYSHRETSNHGGAAIFVSSNIPYKRRHDLELNITNCESVFVEFDSPVFGIDNRNLVFGCIYRSPCSLVTDFCSALDRTMEKISCANCNGIIMGDINVNLLDTTSSNSSRYSSNFHSFGYECLITLPTRCPNNVDGTLIDHALSNLTDPPEAGIVNTDFTDHYPIVLRFRNHSTFGNTSYYRIVLDKEIFLTSLTKTDWSEVVSTNDPQTAFSQFLSTLSLLFNSHSHKQKCRKKVASPQNPWLTDSLLKAMRSRENLYKKTTF